MPEISDGGFLASRQFFEERGATILNARVDGVQQRLAERDERDARMEDALDVAWAAVAASAAEAEARSWAKRFRLRRLLIACLPVFDAVNYVPVGVVRLAMGLPYSWPDEPNVWRKGVGWIP